MEDWGAMLDKAKVKVLVETKGIDKIVAKIADGELEMLTAMVINGLGLEPIDKASYMEDWVFNTYSDQTHQMLRDYGFKGKIRCKNSSCPVRAFKRYLPDEYEKEATQLLVNLQDYGDAFWSDGQVYYFEDLEEGLKALKN